MNNIASNVRETQKVNFAHKTIQVRRGTTAEWAEFGDKCMPLAGEICAEFVQDGNGQTTGSVMLKVGNGIDVWNGLPYLLTDTNFPAYDLSQEDIDNLMEILANGGSGGGGASSWDELTGKPSTFPPSVHRHPITDIDGLEVRLDEIEDSITDGGGFVDAPEDNVLYGRLDGDWEPVPPGVGMVVSDTEPQNPAEGLQWLDSTTATVWIWDGGRWLQFPVDASSDWADIENKPTEFNPTAHQHPEYAQAADVTANTSDIADNTAAIATKLDADKIWTGTQTEYDNLSPDADTLYFIV